MSTIFENKLVRIEIEPSQIPWLKIFTKDSCKEFSQCSRETRNYVFELLHTIETEMLIYFQPEKINIASFANYLPKVHWHIMARFQDDNFFPEPMWGEQQRESSLNLPPMENFINQLVKEIENISA